MFKEFRKFILRGNVVDLAVAVVIGAAFNAVVQSLVADFIKPLITGFTGNKAGAVQGVWHIGTKFAFNWGDFVSNVISFALIAAVVFFLVVQPINRLIAFSNRNKQSDDPTTKKCPECLSEVPIKAARCAFCTSKIS